MENYVHCHSASTQDERVVCQLKNVAIFLLFITIGASTVFLYMLLLLFFERQYRVKAKFILVSGFAFVGCFAGLKSLVEHIYNFIEIMTKKENVPMTVNECLVKVPHLWMSIFCSISITAVQLALSLEALFAFCKFGLRYKIFTKRTTWIILSACLGLALVVTIALLWDASVLHGHEMVERCRSVMCYRKTFYQGLLISFFTIQIFCIVLFVATFFLYKKQARTIKNEMQLVQLKIELKIAKCVVTCLVIIVVSQALPILWKVLVNEYQPTGTAKFLEWLIHFSWTLSAIVFLFFHPAFEAQTKSHCKWIYKLCRKGNPDNLTPVIYIGS